MARYPVELDANDCVESVEVFTDESVILYDVTLGEGCSKMDIMEDLPEQYNFYGRMYPPSGDFVLIDENQPSAGIEQAR